MSRRKKTGRGGPPGKGSKDNLGEIIYHPAVKPHIEKAAKKAKERIAELQKLSRTREGRLESLNRLMEKRMENSLPEELKGIAIDILKGVEVVNLKKIGRRILETGIDGLENYRIGLPFDKKSLKALEEEESKLLSELNKTLNRTFLSIGNQRDGKEFIEFLKNNGLELTEKGKLLEIQAIDVDLAISKLRGLK